MSYLPTNSIQAVIFDVDGVLLDTNPIHHLAWQKVFQKVGLTFTYQDYVEKASGVHRNQVIGHIVSNPSQADLDYFSKLKNQFTEEVVKEVEIPLVEKVLEFVEFLAPKYKLGAASSSQAAPDFLRTTKLFEKLNSIRGGKQLINPKPHPEIYLNSAYELGVKPENCLVIEDMAIGVLSAKNAKMYSCGLLHTGDMKIQLEADFVVYNFKEYRKIINFFAL